MDQRFNPLFFKVIGVLICLLTLAEVNYPLLTPQSQLALFALLGLSLVFLKHPLAERFRMATWAKALDLFLIALTIASFGYVVIQNEPLFQSIWSGGNSLGNRAGIETSLDSMVGLVGLLLVLEAARRAIGWTLPLLSSLFIAYAAFGSHMPDWLFPHRGYSVERIVGQTFLQSQGVFGIALKVMFSYVFLFVIFGAMLERTGATKFIIDFSRNLFKRGVGGPAKVAVLSSGLMGSLSGSAVANTATTGTFTIPMMRAAGFSPTVAAAVEAAASSGGALVPPVMGAGAYMMLELIPNVSFVQIMRAAILPAILYYAALLFIVHFYARRIGAVDAPVPELNKPSKYPGLIFCVAFLALILLLLVGFTPFRAVSLTLVVIWVASLFRAETRLDLKAIIAAFTRSAQSGVPLVAAGCCVGIVIGVVTLTGIGSKLPGVLLPLAQGNLVLGLILLMVATIILGMGLPSAVCYLLMATLVGPVLGDLGVVPLAAHLFIYYFGMMSMVTPPVALAAYTAATIAEADIMKTGLVAFRFALVGFILPFAFVLHPALLMLDSNSGMAGVGAITVAALLTLLAVLAMSVSVTGFWFAPVVFWQRALLMVSAFALLLTAREGFGILFQVVAGLLVLVLGVLSWRKGLEPAAAS